MKKVILFLLGLLAGSYIGMLIEYYRRKIEDDSSYNDGIQDMKENCINEIKQWYWDSDIQNIKYDPCVVDSMIDLSIRTIKNKEEELRK